MVREPAVAGQFYEGGREPLLEQVRGCFLRQPGPGSLPKAHSERVVKAAIVPHAGFMFSGYAAAHAYRAIGEAKKPDVFIVIGPNHSLPMSSVCLEGFETPLGIVKADKKLGELICRSTGLEAGSEAQVYEHSVEVQLPFLQFIYGKDMPQFVPIVVSDVDYVRLGKGIKKAIADYGKRVCVLASSDFTHYGPGYGYRPFSANVRENLAKLDNAAFEFIAKKDSRGFMDYIDRTGATICGKYPICVLLEAIDIKKATKLCHYSSGDIAGSYTNSVDYISAVFE